MNHIYNNNAIITGPGIFENSNWAPVYRRLVSILTGLYKFQTTEHGLCVWDIPLSVKIMCFKDHGVLVDRISVLSDF